MELINKFLFYWQYPFVRYAFIVGILIALCSSLLGVTLVLKRYSYIGDGLSHVAFGAMAVATILKDYNKFFIIIPITIIVAILLLKTGQNAKIKGDALIAMLSVGSLAIGYLLLNRFSTAANVSGDVCSTLFGSISIITLSKQDVYACIVMSVVVILIYCIFYNRIFAITFDENFAKATGLNTDLYNTVIAVIIAVIIVLGMTLVGSLLISALVVFPSLSAMRLVSSFKRVVIISVVISVFCALTGIFMSIVFSTPVGSTIVAVNMFIFLLSVIIKKFIGEK